MDDVLNTVGECSACLSTSIDSLENKPKDADERKMIGRRLARLDKLLTHANETKSWAGCNTIEIPVLKQHDKQLQGYKRELADVNSKLFTLNADDSDDLVTQHAHLEQEQFATSLQIKKNGSLLNTFYHHGTSKYRAQGCC